MKIDNEMVKKMEREDVYIYHKAQRRMFHRVAGSGMEYYCKYPGEKPFKVDRNTTSVTDALIYGVEVNGEDYEKF
jgi:hypothetical protein